MTPRSMDKTASRVSEERLAEMIGLGCDQVARHEVYSMALELQSLRSLSSYTAPPIISSVLTTEATTDKVEQVAREMAKRDGKDPDALSHNSFQWWRHFVPQARASLSIPSPNLSTIALDSGTGGQQPDWCPQSVWDEAERIADANDPSTETLARAILAAEKRGEEREREACAVYHDDKAAEHEAFREDSRGDMILHHHKMVRMHVSAADAIRTRSTP